MSRQEKQTHMRWLSSQGLLIVSFLLAAFFFTSCTKSSGLVGSGSAPSTGSSISGTVQGGLSAIGGSTVSLYQAGNPPVLLGTATTNKDGTFNFTAPSSASGLLYIVVTGGNAGNGTNNSIQLMALAGTASSPTTTLSINELTSAVAQLVTMNFGLLLDSNGNTTVNAAANQTGASNAVTQYANLVTPNTGVIVSGLATSLANGLNTMANAFASCVENTSGCSTLMSTATGTSGSAASTLLESGFNMLSNSSTTASGVYSLAFPLASSTGFSLPSSSLPGGFTFNNALAGTQKTISVGNGPSFAAIDASGNVWVTNTSAASVTKLNSSGVSLGTFAVTGPRGIAIDASGNVWIPNGGSGNVTQLSSSGSILNTFAIGGAPNDVAIDASGNIWVTRTPASTSITKLSSSGASLATPTVAATQNGIGIDAFGNVWVANQSNNTAIELNSSGSNLGTFSTGGLHANGVAFDPSGNAWVSNFSSNNITKFNSSGVSLGVFSVGTGPFGFAIDSSGNVWVGNFSSNNVTELNSSGIKLGTFSAGSGAQAVAIDASGNAWVVNNSAASVTEIVGVSSGPEFFPYSGPQFAYPF